MRKLKLPQPYASMVIAGTLKTIPDIWGDVEYNEKIFIYADGVDKEFENGLDLDNEMHQKVFNEMFYGNIPDETFIVDAYLGYVFVTHTGDLMEEWFKRTDRFLFVNCAHEFDEPICNFDTKIKELVDAPAHRTKIRRMRREGDTLMVPVGEYTWNILRDKNDYKNVYMFWESYMSEIVQPLLSMEDDDRNEIEDIYFKYKNHTMRFYTNFQVGADVVGDKTHTYFIFRFDLDDLAMGSETDFKEDPHTEKAGFELDERNELSFKKDSPSKNGRRQWIHFISVPMGGQPGWRRR